MDRTHSDNEYDHPEIFRIRQRRYRVNYGSEMASGWTRETIFEYICYFTCFFSIINSLAICGNYISRPEFEPGSKNEILTIIKQIDTNLNKEIDEMTNKMKGYAVVSNVKGDTGERGPAGQKGDPGDHGIDRYFSICYGSSTTCPKGDKGQEGEMGLPGNQGIPGYVGEIGIRGFPGDEGIPGVKGEIGNQGRPGRPGLNGEPGSNCHCTLQ